MVGEKDSQRNEMSLQFLAHFLRFIFFAKIIDVYHIIGEKIES